MEEKEITLKLYSPLLATIYSNKEFSSDEEDPCAALVFGDDVACNAKIIQAVIEQYNKQNGENLMTFFDETQDPGLKAKVGSVTPSVECQNGELMGCTTLRLKEPLCASEMDKLKDFLYELYSNDWGKGLEQQEILCEDSVVHVHFGKADPFYFGDGQHFDPNVKLYPIRKNGSLKKREDDAR